MKRRIEIICTWGGVAFAVLFFVGFVLFAKFLPPLSPNDTAERTAEIYRENPNGIRTGLALCYFGTMFYLVFGAGIIGQTRRIRGVAPTIIIVQIAAFAASSLLIILPITMWFTAAFRPESQSAENIQILNDFGWISFVVGFPPFVVWICATGLAILSDQSRTPMYPRWVGYFSLLMAFIQMAPPIVLIYVKTGPFAWNGILAWWIPMTDFFLWFMVITVFTLKAIDRRYEEEAASADSASIVEPHPVPSRG
ncbi:hypothetical protein [Nocardia neocaledoniensis]|uniref:hypothetical protein n=1 Tax=Nocardia neocaledoniensis TaxID=236511 RepID=UPI0024559F19|nr:hypothetical protein [Nocardia neocaledoniensis]